MSATDKIKNAIEDVEGKGKEGARQGHRRPQHRERGSGKDQAKVDLKDAGENVKDAFER